MNDGGAEQELKETASVCCHLFCLPSFVFKICKIRGESIPFSRVLVVIRRYCLYERLNLNIIRMVRDDERDMPLEGRGEWLAEGEDDVREDKRRISTLPRG